MGNNHNRSVAWVRFWAALGAQVVVDSKVYGERYQDIAQDLAAYEARRFATACYALGTTEQE